ncbi:hypothetical protein LXL04_000977 [Taraxacum kok-saghyz]
MSLDEKVFMPPPLIDGRTDAAPPQRLRMKDVQGMPGMSTGLARVSMAALAEAACSREAYSTMDGSNEDSSAMGINEPGTVVVSFLRFHNSKPVESFILAFIQSADNETSARHLRGTDLDLPLLSSANIFFIGFGFGKEKAAAYRFSLSPSRSSSSKSRLSPLNLTCARRTLCSPVLDLLRRNPPKSPSTSSELTAVAAYFGNRDLLRQQTWFSSIFGLLHRKSQQSRYLLA